MLGVFAPPAVLSVGALTVRREGSSAGETRKMERLRTASDSMVFQPADILSRTSQRGGIADVRIDFDERMNQSRANPTLS